MTKNQKAKWDAQIITYLRQHDRFWADGQVAMGLYNTSREEGRTDADLLTRSVEATDKAMRSFRSAMLCRDSAWVAGYTDIDFDALKVEAAKPEWHAIHA
jgi:hypothetical protein